jgi:hypothetical protein
MWVTRFVRLGYILGKKHELAIRFSPLCGDETWGTKLVNAIELYDPGLLLFLFLPNHTLLFTLIHLY